MKNNPSKNREFPDDFINKIICGDCLDVMKDIPDKSVDLVLTDPPYGINFGSEKESMSAALRKDGTHRNIEKIFSKGKVRGQND